MLFPGFPLSACPEKSSYRLAEEFISIVLQQNSEELESGREFRLQQVYTDEMWLKLRSLGLGTSEWQGVTVLDACAGKGFVTHHLLKKASPARVVLADLNRDDMQCARDLLTGHAGPTQIEFMLGDILELPLPAESFDFIIGNSFLHHLWDVGKGMSAFRKLLKPGGVFITLHEPTPMAISVESGGVPILSRALLKGPSYLERMRWRSDGVAPGAGSDVWLFEPHELINLVRDARFVDIRTAHWHFARSILTARLNLHLSEQRQTLGSFGAGTIRFGNRVDGLLRALGLTRIFGSVALSCRRPR